MSVAPINLHGSAARTHRADQTPQANLPELRRAAEQLVGMTFFQTLLDAAQNTTLKGKYGHGGRGEDVFRGQMNAIFAERSAASSNFPLVDAIYDRMAQRYRNQIEAGPAQSQGTATE